MAPEVVWALLEAVALGASWPLTQSYFQPLLAAVQPSGLSFSDESIQQATPPRSSVGPGRAEPSAACRNALPVLHSPSINFLSLLGLIEVQWYS